MKQLTILSLFVILTGCGAWAKTPSQIDKVKAEELETVQVVTVDGSKPRMYCAGVWVSPWQYLTAAHCPLAMTPDGVDSESWDPIGQPSPYRVQDDAPNSYHEGRVAAYSLQSDLALVYALSPVPAHPYVKVATLSTQAGEPVDIIGHPVGYSWSFARGYISAYRSHELNTHRLPMLTFQIAGPVSPGNSGGGAFNSSGDLVGIASYLDSRLNGMAFFVHQDAIRKFLQDNDIQPKL